MNSPFLQRPTPALIEQVLAQSWTHGRYAAADAALNRLFHQFPSNADLSDILLEVTCLNRLYSTNVYAIFDMAEHIKRLDIDPRLARGDIDLVEDIADLNLNGKPRRCYSFATKYCSWHAPDRYAIYDRFVVEAIEMFAQHHDFASFTSGSIYSSYPKYYDVIVKFRDHFHLTKFTLKQIDQFLWSCGKEAN